MGGTAVSVAWVVFAAAVVVFGSTLIAAVRTDVTSAPEVVRGQVQPEPESPGLGSGGEVADSGGGGDRLPMAEVPQESQGPAPVSVPETWRGGAYPRVSQEEILEAVNEDLFQPGRVPPPERYRLPAQRPDVGLASGTERRRREPNLRIVGTAIAGDLAIALVQLEDSIPFAVVVGEEVDGYTVASVREESVTLTDADDEFVFPVVEADLSRSSNSGNRGSRGDNARVDDATRILQERVQQLLQQMGRGQMGRGGNNPGIDVPLRVQTMPGGTLPPNVIIRTRPGGGGGGSLP